MSFESQEFSIEQDRALLNFVMNNSEFFDRCEVFEKAHDQVEVLQSKTIFELYMRYHKYIFPLFTGQASDEVVASPPSPPPRLVNDLQDFSFEEDRSLLKFVMDNSTVYDKYEVFQEAQWLEPTLAKRTALDLYMRYHQYLFPLFTGQPSGEAVWLPSSNKDSTEDTVKDELEHLELRKESGLHGKFEEHSVEYDEYTNSASSSGSNSGFHDRLEALGISFHFLKNGYGGSFENLATVLENNFYRKTIRDRRSSIEQQ